MRNFRPNPFLSIEWNYIRINGPGHGIVTKTVHKSLQGCGGKGRLGLCGLWAIGWWGQGVRGGGHQGGWGGVGQG